MFPSSKRLFNMMKILLMSKKNSNNSIFYPIDNENRHQFFRRNKSFSQGKQLELIRLKKRFKMMFSNKVNTNILIYIILNTNKPLYYLIIIQNRSIQQYTLFSTKNSQDRPEQVGNMSKKLMVVVNDQYSCWYKPEHYTPITRFPFWLLSRQKVQKYIIIWLFCL